MDDVLFNSCKVFLVQLEWKLIFLNVLLAYFVCCKCYANDNILNAKTDTDILCSIQHADSTYSYRFVDSYPNCVKSNKLF